MELLTYTSCDLPFFAFAIKMWGLSRPVCSSLAVRHKTYTLVGIFLEACEAASALQGATRLTSTPRRMASFSAKLDYRVVTIVRVRILY